MPIPWGSSEPPPDRHAHFEHIRHEACPYCGYESSASRATGARKLLARHIQKKHPGQELPASLPVESMAAMVIRDDGRSWLTPTGINYGGCARCGTEFMYEGDIRYVRPPAHPDPSGIDVYLADYGVHVESLCQNCHANDPGLPADTAEPELIGRAMRRMIMADPEEFIGDMSQLSPKATAQVRKMIYESMATWNPDGTVKD